eukprot:TRINITY_DN57461_c0_g1_i1.p1 TRINITY_DN57461_c0_g1~~TRINITY_DN57461_c0_g1_i1.p1  ORF type:complete len:324 (+),score=28.83 TRINITY_DN57461_c0_g1_i1:71-973(+)
MPIVFVSIVIPDHANNVVFIVWKFWDTSRHDTEGRDMLYRLADVVTTQKRWLGGGEQFHLKWFPDSIASEYMRETNRQEDLRILNEIINKRAKLFFGIETGKLNETQLSTLSVHLRIGDVVEGKTMEDLFVDRRNTTAGQWANHFIPLSFYDQYKLPRGVSRVTFFGSTCHNTISTASSFAYANFVRRAFMRKLANRNTSKVAHRAVSRLPMSCLVNQTRVAAARTLARRADEDLVLMLTMASRIVVSGGGFGRLINRLAKYRGIRVDDPLENYGRFADTEPRIVAEFPTGMSKWFIFGR